MTHTLPDLGSLFDETKSIVKSYFWDFSRVILPGIILPVLLIGVTLCQSVDLSKLALGSLLLLEIALLSVAFIRCIPRITAIALAASYGEEPNFAGLPIGKYIAMTLVLMVPTFVLQQLLKFVGLGALNILVTVGMYYVGIRLILSTMILVAGEGGVWYSIVRSWNLMRGVTMRFLLYRLAFGLPAGFLTGILCIVMILTFLSNVHPLNYETLRYNIPVVIGAIVLAVLPGLAFALYFMTALDAVIYRWLSEQERAVLEDESPLATME